MAALDKFRQKYPQYNNLSDIEVATRLAKKYPDNYSDLLKRVEIEELDKQYAETVTSTPEEQSQFKRLQKTTDVQPEITASHPGRQAVRTLENIGQVYPALETAGQMATGAGAQVLGGVTGLVRVAGGQIVGEGLDESLRAGKDVVQGVQGALTYQPRTQRGQELSESAMVPFTALQRGAQATGDVIEEAGFPNVAAGVATAMEAAPMVVGAKAVPKNPVTALAKNARKTKQVVTDTMNKAIKPKFKSKKTTTKVKEYDNKALTAVEEIVRGKDELKLIDESGRAEARLPESVVDFQEAISQTKERVFKEFTEAAEGAQARGIRIDTREAAQALDDIISDEVTGNFTPKIIEYAIERQNMLDRMSIGANLGTGRGMTPLQTQQAIKQLNVSLQAYERSPSVQNYNTAMVDAVIVNNLRKSLDQAIEKAPVAEYQPLKNKYSALKAIEDDVNKMANTERNKVAGTLLPDFTDVIAGHQVVSGIISGNPATLAGAATIKGMSRVRKMMKDPNKRVKNMFQTVDKNLAERAIVEGKLIQRRAKERGE